MTSFSLAFLPGIPQCRGLFKRSCPHMIFPAKPSSLFIPTMSTAAQTAIPILRRPAPMQSMVLKDLTVEATELLEAKGTVAQWLDRLEIPRRLS